MKGDRERCLQAGMDDYLPKPIRATELFAVIDRVLAGGQASKAPLAWSTEPGVLVDPDTLLAACDDDPILLGNIIHIFNNNIVGFLARVKDAVSRHDPAHLRESAHQLRGLLSTFSTKAAQAAALLEAMGAGGELGDAASTYKTLADMIERLGPLLQNLPIDKLRRSRHRQDKNGFSIDVYNSRSFPLIAGKHRRAWSQAASLVGTDGEIVAECGARSGG
jgi:two-component system, sensor histidine kinase and response regulator